MKIKLIEGLSLIYMHRNITGLYQVLQTKCSFNKTLIPLKLSVSLLSVHLWSTKAGASLKTNRSSDQGPEKYHATRKIFASISR